MAVTRDDVAKAAGVSTAVVSYVLNNGPRPVAAATKERVLAAIRDLGYRRDGVARHLRVGRTQSIGLVVPDLALPYFAEFTKHLTAAGVASDRQILVADSAWNLERERTVLAELAERKVDAIVLLSADPVDDLTSRTPPGVPVVVVDRPEVVTGGTAAAVEHLASHGHRDLGLVAGPGDLRTSRRRSQAWADALHANGLELRSEWVHHTEISRKGGFEAALKLLGDEHRPTAILIESDAQSLGFLRAAHDCGVAVPKQCALITAEGTEHSLYSIPSLTTIAQPINALAEAAFEAAIHAEPTRSGPTLHRISDQQFELTVRESCGTH